MQFGDHAGALHVALPATMIEPVREQLDAGTAGGASASQGEWSSALARQLGDAPVELRVDARDVTLTLRELLALKPGDVIPTDLQETITVVFRRRAALSRALRRVARRQRAAIVDRITPGEEARRQEPGR